MAVRVWRRPGLWWAAGIVVVALLTCWFGNASLKASARDEQRKSDHSLATYLGLLVAGDYSGARLMLCGGDDMALARLGDTELTAWTEHGISSFTVRGARPWSSIDGHGTVYDVDLTLSREATATIDVVVEIIDDEPCIGTDFPV
ncbi:hypothetical protein O7623_15885 [Solwaraspora sp. WMMD791]|uniref:hypothetical protein n=1 Tax=Solwaraspora sp. WMMD791 TaxID=3016086 RepID=UPI00249C057F|nr:hypothetical protein [Solwaraspora sp. WMMD791]WFE24914.1 hypothetical protein O7623_15885 [Solwaraspora sp. WMMD791]